MKRLILWSALILISCMFASCCSAKKAENMKYEPKVLIPGPKVIIYQTKKDYSKFVPVILSDDKKTIESYPDIRDVYYDGKLAYPTQLHDGYLLDNRGISLNVAFINLTYEEYSTLPETPRLQQLLNMITDADPIVVMYNCGSRSSYKDIVKELNARIDAGDFSTFIKVK